MSEQSLREAFYAYLNDYFTLRDFNKTKTHFATSITGFGTSKDEQTYTFDDFRRYFQRDIEGIPNPIDYEIKAMKVTLPKDDVGLITCEIDISTTVKNQQIKLNGTRYTLTFIKEQSGWKIHHKHLSLPSQINDDDEPFPIKELEERNKALERMVDEKTRQLNSTLKEVSFHANHDFLTAIPNRMRIDKVLDEIFLKPTEERINHAILLVDIDNFKTINDTRGHLIGDEVLKIAAKTFKKHSPKDATVGRWGGDEFIIILPNISLTEAKTLADTLRKTFQQAVNAFGVTAQISLGVSQINTHDTVDDLLSRCDNALYQAKTAGKNMVKTL